MVVTNQLPSIDQVPELSESHQSEILDILFEPAPPLHQQCQPVLRQRHESWYNLIYTGVGQVLRTLHTQSLESTTNEAAMAREVLDGILASHPRLGAKKVDSAASTSEQAHLQSGSSEEESRRLADLNAKYEAQFPPLRFVVFVNGRPRSKIMQIMRERIDRDQIEDERRESIQAMLDIAWDRAQKMGGSK